jgi:glycosyltransferase involved in cell wall biosynthesis
MLRGTPVLATDLPGVRTIVQRTGMGEIVPRGDAHELANALERVLYAAAFERREPDEVTERLELHDTARMYEELFERIAKGEPI